MRARTAAPEGGTSGQRLIDGDTKTLPRTADRELHHFLMLSHDEQRAAIQRLAASGMSDYVIAAATRLSVEMVRTILGEQPGADT